MIIKSPSPEVTIPDISLPVYFLQRLANYDQEVALIEGETGREISYATLKNNIHSVATALAQRGFKPGDVFGLYAPNSPEYVITYHAVLLMGGVVTTANPLYSADELAHQLKHSHCKCLFTDSELLEKANAACDIADIKHLYVYNQETGNNSFKDLIDQPIEAEFSPLHIDADSTIAVLPYSSGTTGLPKGVMLSHKNLVTNCYQLDYQIDTSSPRYGDRLIGLIPLFHIFGMTVNMNVGLTNGATLVTMRRFNPELFLQLIEKHQINMAYLVPPVILFLGNDPLVEQYDIGSLEYILSGAAPLGEEQSLSISAHIQCPIVQGYGLTEASPVTHRIPDKLGNTRQGSIGVLVPNAEAMIVDLNSHQPLPVGESGELFIRSPQVMKGYLDNPEATAATINDDGWLQTGDIGYVDEAGYFYIADRLKELIKYNAYQVAPAELEALLLTHDDILDAAVVPAPDPKAGEIPKAFIVLHKDRLVSAEQIMQWTEDRIASYKKIRSVEFIEQIPKSPSGKILRRLLRDKH